MKHLCLAAACLSSVLASDEIRLNVVSTPNKAVLYYVDDRENFGDVSGPQEKIGESFLMRIGEIKDEGYTAVRKNFLLFHLPPLEGKKLTRARLLLFLWKVQHESPERILPPAWIFHAKEWQDESWLSDLKRHGLQTFHFADSEIFAQKTLLCEPDATTPGVIELDVTGMIQADYQRNTAPVAAFRLEISDREALNVTEPGMNAYVFYAAGDLENPDNAPTLVLSFE